MTLGVGAGQMMHRPARIASISSQRWLMLRGSAVASDAFSRLDGLDVVVDAGATCVIQPGGSMRGRRVIAAADERGGDGVDRFHFRH
jgi:phosphoribosylaminoimidazolecarboxamide formyltransferase/IMP cyclohydrolase